MFRPGSAMMSTPIRQQVDAVAARMRADAALRVRISGMSDGADDASLRLAQARIDVARRWLVSSGIEARRIAVLPPEVVSLPASTPHVRLQLGR